MTHRAGVGRGPTQLRPALRGGVERTLALVGRLLRARVHGLDAAVLALLAGLVLPALLRTLRTEGLPQTGAALQDVQHGVEAAGLAGPRLVIRLVGRVC